MTPMQALRAATHGVHCLGLVRKLGTLEKGRLADLVVVNGSPLAESACSSTPRASAGVSRSARCGGDRRKPLAS